MGMGDMQLKLGAQSARPFGNAISAKTTPPSQSLQLVSYPTRQEVTPTSANTGGGGNKSSKLNFLA
jgi:hypothetical protein